MYKGLYKIKDLKKNKIELEDRFGNEIESFVNEIITKRDVKKNIGKTLELEGILSDNKLEITRLIDRRNERLYDEIEYHINKLIDTYDENINISDINYRIKECLNLINDVDNPLNNHEFQYIKYKLLYIENNFNRFKKNFNKFSFIKDKMEKIDMCDMIIKKNNNTINNLISLFYDLLDFSFDNKNFSCKNFILLKSDNLLKKINNTEQKAEVEKIREIAKKLSEKNYVEDFKQELLKNIPKKEEFKKEIKTNEKEIDIEQLSLF